MLFPFSQIQFRASLLRFLFSTLQHTYRDPTLDSKMESVDVKAERLKEKYIGFLMDSFRARATEVNFDANPLAVMPALEPSSAVEPLPTEVYVPKRDKHIRFTFSIVKQEKNPELERRRSELSSSVSQLPAPEKTLLLEKLDALINKEIKQESEFDIWDEDKASIPFWPLVQKVSIFCQPPFVVDSIGCGDRLLCSLSTA